MKRIELDPEAAAEVRRAIEFLDTRRDGLGAEFEAEFRAALDLIARQPKAFSPYRGRYRKYVISEFGYLIFYTEFDDYVWVAAVPHGKQRPDYWIDREPNS